MARNTTATAPKLSKTALRMLDHTVSDHRNNTPMDERCAIHRYGRAGSKAAEALVAASLCRIDLDPVFGDRLIVTEAGVEYHTKNEQKVDSATDPLNIRSATAFY